MRVAINKFMEFCEANPETSAEAFLVSKGDFELYCKIMDFGANVFMRTEIACMSREMENMQCMNDDLDDDLDGCKDDSEDEIDDSINLNPSDKELELFLAEHDLKTDEPYEFAAMKETAAELEEKRKIDEHPISKLFNELFGKNMGIWL